MKLQKISKTSAAMIGVGVVTNIAVVSAIVIENTTQVAEVPAPAPVEQVVTAPTTPDYEYPTREGALKEMCDAAREYRGHVLAGRATVEQGKQEVRSYSTYLSQNSPASKNDLLHAGMGCSLLWKF